jgi:hypothetical protein
MKGIDIKIIRSLFLILILSFFSQINLIGQIDSSKIFEKSKGTWHYPINHFSKVSDCKITSRKILFTPIKNIVFTTDSAYPVTAVYEGKVVNISLNSGVYFLITKFGDYYLVYNGLEKPALQIGDYLLKGEKISILKNIENKNTYELEIYLTSKEGDEIFPCDWFIRNPDT